MSVMFCTLFMIHRIKCSIDSYIISVKEARYKHKALSFIESDKSFASLNVRIHVISNKTLKPF